MRKPKAELICDSTPIVNISTLLSERKLLKSRSTLNMETPSELEWGVPQVRSCPNHLCCSNVLSLWLSERAQQPETLRAVRTSREAWMEDGSFEQITPFQCRDFVSCNANNLSWGDGHSRAWLCWLIEIVFIQMTRHLTTRKRRLSERGSLVKDYARNTCETLVTSPDCQSRNDLVNLLRRRASNTFFNVWNVFVPFPGRPRLKQTSAMFTADDRTNGRTDVRTKTQRRKWSNNNNNIDIDTRKEKKTFWLTRWKKWN